MRVLCAGLLVAVLLAASAQADVTAGAVWSYPQLFLQDGKPAVSFAKESYPAIAQRNLLGQWSSGEPLTELGGIWGDCNFSNSLTPVVIDGKLLLGMATFSPDMGLALARRVTGPPEEAWDATMLALGEPSNTEVWAVDLGNGNAVVASRILFHETWSERFMAWLVSAQGSALPVEINVPELEFPLDLAGADGRLFILSTDAEGIWLDAAEGSLQSWTRHLLRRHADKPGYPNHDWPESAMVVTQDRIYCFITLGEQGSTAEIAVFDAPIDRWSEQAAWNQSAVSPMNGYQLAANTVSGRPCLTYQTYDEHGQISAPWFTYAKTATPSSPSDWQVHELPEEAAESILDVGGKPAFVFYNHRKRQVVYMESQTADPQSARDWKRSVVHQYPAYPPGKSITSQVALWVPALVLVGILGGAPFWFRRWRTKPRARSLPGSRDQPDG